MTELSRSDIFKKVSLFCHSRLWNDEAAVAYLQEDRKLTEETIRKFQIGVFPNDLRELFGVVSAKDLRAVGLIRHASKSSFQTRDVVIPIRDVYGDYIALTGRSRLSEEKRSRYNISKYYNSVYPKAQHLFGLNLAKESILKTGVAYVVEGHYDVITPHQHGMSNVVATCGSSFTMRQMALLSRYTDNIILIFDNEPKAISLANQLVQKRNKEGIELSTKNPFPPNIKDLDEYLKNHSLDSLRKRLESGEFDDINPFWE